MTIGSAKKWKFVGALALALAAAGPARAGSVDIVGGFYNYFGPLEEPRAVGFQSTFDVPGLGTVIGTPTETIPGFENAFALGVGNGAVYFFSTSAGAPPPAPVASVDFYRDRSFDLPPRNRIAFTPSTGLDLTVGDSFKLGTFSFANGGWLGDFPAGVFSFSARTASATPELDGHIFNASIAFHITTGCSADYATCSTDPVDNADYFEIIDYPVDLRPPVVLAYIGLFEPEHLPSGGSNTGSVDLYARIGSLIPTGLADPQGVTLQAVIPVVLNPVPEPDSWALWLGGIGGLGALTAVRRRRALLGRCAR